MGVYLYIRQKREQKLAIKETMKEMLAIPSPIQDGVIQFVSKREFEFGKLIEKADSAFHNGNFSIAESLYIKAFEVAEEPKEKGLALMGIGAANGVQGKFEDTIRNLRKALKYRRAIKDNIAIGRVYFNLGVCYQSIGRISEAIKNYSTAIKLNQKDAEAYNNRGIAYYDKGDLDRAIADYTKAIELNPKFAKAMANLGRVYHKGKGDKNKAEFWYKEALKNKEFLPDKGKRVQQWLKELQEEE